MLPADIPATGHLLELIDHRDDASVSIALPSSPLPHDHDRIRLSLRNAVDEAERQLEAKDLPRDRVANTIAPLRALGDDQEFWTHQSRSLVVFAAPDLIETFRIANTVDERVSVGDRFDAGPLLRAVTFRHRAFVIALSESAARLIEIGPDHRPEERALDLPSDHQLMLERTTTGGRFDRQRADGATGDRPERERYARAVQDGVVSIVPDDVPLILAASNDLGPAYRSVNTHPLLLDEEISPHPESLDDARVSDAAREILDRRYAAQIDQWRERFGELRAGGLATTRISDVAQAAAAAAIDELHFDMDATLEGDIDEFGNLRKAAEPGPETYAVVDEIAARVLRSGGTVRAVRQSDLLDGSPVAATLRFPLSA